jgi:hypothetical protein
LSLSGLEYSAWRDDIARLNQLAEIGRLEPVGGELVLGEFQIDCLLLHSSTLYLRGLGSALQGPGDEIGEVVQLGVTVFVARRIG